jgi:hypothetical protein
MCPACLVSAGVMIGGAISGGGLSFAVIGGFFRKVWKRMKGEQKWLLR